MRRPEVDPSHGLSRATLSRLEQMVAWTTLLDPVETFAYAENNTFLHQPGIMPGVLELNLNFEQA